MYIYASYICKNLMIFEFEFNLREDFFFIPNVRNLFNTKSVCVFFHGRERPVRNLFNTKSVCVFFQGCERPPLFPQFPCLHLPLQGKVCCLLQLICSQPGRGCFTSILESSVSKPRWWRNR